jgi:hypothetical protein
MVEKAVIFRPHNTTKDTKKKIKKIFQRKHLFLEVRERYTSVKSGIKVSAAKKDFKMSIQNEK